MALLNDVAKTAITATILAAVGTFNTVSAADLSAVPSGTYSVDPTHAYINFQYNHLGLSNPTLGFDNFTMDLNLDNADPTKSTVNVTIDPASIISGSEQWTKHLVGSEFFDVANHPEITFQSTSVEAAGEGAFKVMGDLTIKGESKPAALNVSINAAMNHPMSGDPVVGLEASGTLLRSEYGMGKFAPNVSDEIALNITAELVKAK